MRRDRLVPDAGSAFDQPWSIANAPRADEIFALKAAPMAAAAGSSISGTIAGGFAVSLSTLNGAAINAAKETWVIVHGWNSSGGDVQELADEAQNQRPSAQILILDWAQAAAAVDPAVAEDHVADVGAWAAGALTSKGFAGGKINFIGYSYGAYVAAETAKGMAGGADVIVAIDPGADAPGSVYDPPSAVNFAAISKYSLSFFADDFYGNAVTAQTADEAIAVRNSDHSAAYHMVVNLLASIDGDGAGADAFFTLSRLIGHQAGPWISNQFFSTGALGPGRFDAALNTGNAGNMPNGLDAVIFTNSADNETLGNGAAGIHALGGDDIVRGSAGADVIYGDAGKDRLEGLDGADTLDGGVGADVLIGGNGADIYVVDNAGDVVTEASAAGGVDRVSSSVSFALGANIEQLAFWGSGNVNGTGNALNNVLAGNAGANILNGGVGADTMIGGLGDDIYVVDNVGDVVADTSAAGGVDRVSSSITYALGANIEQLAFWGSANVNGTGNALNNVLAGNAGANTLNGGLGADTMIGGLGNDIYVVDNAGDVVAETSASGGVDRVSSSISYALGANIEQLAFWGSANVNGTGNALNNVIAGNAAANKLDGGLGADTLIGGAGADTFVFAAGPLNASNRDVISDFNVADDTIALENALFTALGANGALDANAFATGAAAIDASDRVIYDSATGALLYDADGDGVAAAAVQFATLSTGLTLTAADFVII